MNDNIEQYFQAKERSKKDKAGFIIFVVMIITASIILIIK